MIYCHSIFNSRCDCAQSLKYKLIKHNVGQMRRGTRRDLTEPASIRLASNNIDFQVMSKLVGLMSG